MDSRKFLYQMLFVEIMVILASLLSSHHSIENAIKLISAFQIFFVYIVVLQIVRTSKHANLQSFTKSKYSWLIAFPVVILVFVWIFAIFPFIVKTVLLNHGRGTMGSIVSYEYIAYSRAGAYYVSDLQKSDGIEIELKYDNFDTLIEVNKTEKSFNKLYMEAQNHMMITVTYLPVLPS